MREAGKVLKQLFENKEVVGAEVGVCYGDHAESLLQNIPSLHLHLVDDFRELDSTVWSPDLLKRKSKVLPEDRITWHKKTSLDASKEIPDGSLDFVYLDAGHDYKSVKEDCEIWWPKVKKEGILCGHDYMPSIGDEVRKAIDEFAKKLGRKVYLAQNTEDSFCYNNQIYDWLICPILER